VSKDDVVISATAYQPWQIADLPLHRLLSAGRLVERSACANEVRVAVLSDAASQHYCQALTAALKLRGWWPDLYEAEFDTIQQEILDPNSGLYRHRPKFTILFKSVQALAAQFHAAQNKETFANQYVQRLSELWDRLGSGLQTTIVQHNFALPLERPYGNQTLARSASFAGSVARINFYLLDVATNRGIRLVDTESQAAYFGKRQWFDERLWCQARQALSPTFLPSLAKSVTDTLLADLGAAVKCVVLDLDNTLWGGVLGDDGPERIEIGQTELGLVFLRFQRALLELKQRGILLAICSKNHKDSVLKVLDEHPDMVLRSKDFVAIVANYDDKATNLMAIQKKLNLGYDSFVFLDDTPFERDLVRKALPDIQIPDLQSDPANVLSDLARWNLFEGHPPTAEDSERLKYYQQDIQREENREKFSGLQEFLADLRMGAEILDFNSFSLPRVSQLIQRSNQFNLTTIRYSESELKELIGDETVSCFCLRLFDRLGDNGIIAVVVLRKQAADLVIDTWIMSCRVLGRHVEELTVRLMVERARAFGCERMIGRYIPTAKNGLVKDLYPRLKFQRAGSDGEAELFVLDINSYQSPPLPIALQQVDQNGKPHERI
jgi:FkbH-like protein